MNSEPRISFPLSHPWMQAETGLVCRRIQSLTSGNVIKLDELTQHWLQSLAQLMLSEREREIWQKFPYKSPRRYDWLLGRITAKEALQQIAQLELTPADIEILPTTLGKPVLHCPKLAQETVVPDISISHSRGYVVAAVAPPHQRIGIDLERLSNLKFEDWLSCAFLPQELELLPEGSNEIALGFWCAKEAAAKAAGTGFQGNPGDWQITSCSPNRQQITITRDRLNYSVRVWFIDNTEVFAICLMLEQ